jgi:hypothetical protein
MGLFVDVWSKGYTRKVTIVDLVDTWQGHQ